MGVPTRAAIVLTAEPAGPIGPEALDPETAGGLQRLDMLFDEVLGRHGGTRFPAGQHSPFVARFHRARDAVAFALDYHGGGQLILDRGLR